jgi:3-oxoadipate enol-lactonase
VTLDLFFREDGNPAGPAVLLVHAFPTSHELWDPQIDALSARYRVIRPDLRGFGRSPVAASPFRLEHMADDLVALLDRLDIAQVHYVGISMGGMVGQIMALNYPERLCSLALCMTTSEIPLHAPPEDDPSRSISQSMLALAGQRALSEGMTTIANSCLERWFDADFAKTAHARKVANIIAANSAVGYSAGADGLCQFDVSKRLHELQTPTTVLYGELDPVTPPRCSHRLVDLIPKAHLDVVLGARHIANVEQPESFNIKLLNHLERLR